MPIVGLSLEATRDYYSKHDPDRGSPQATKFVIRTLDSRVMAALRDKGTTVMVDPTRPDDEVSTTINLNEVEFMTVQFGLEGWENLVDENGQHIPFRTEGRRLGGKSYQVAHPDILCRVPGAVIKELAAEINRVNDLTEEEEKNSGGPSTP